MVKLVLIGLGGLWIGIAIGSAGGWFAHNQSGTISTLRAQLRSSESNQKQRTQELADAQSQLNEKLAALDAARKQLSLVKCPSLSYGVDGSVAPVSCTIPSPAAVAWAKKADPGLFRLGPNASPQQVQTAVQPGGTIPIECELYQLGQLINRWTFGAPVVQYCNPIQVPTQ